MCTHTQTHGSHTCTCRQGHMYPHACTRALTGAHRPTRARYHTCMQHARVHRETCLCIDACTQRHTHTDTWAHMDLHRHTQTWIHAHTLMHVHRQSCAHMHARIHTRVYHTQPFLFGVLASVVVFTLDPGAESPTGSCPLILCLPLGPQPVFVFYFCWA